jgi:predicted exporter
MLFSSFTGFAQLGLFTIVGLVIALAVTRWVLPALLPARSPFHGATIFAVPLMALMLWVRSGRGVVLVLTIAACLALALHHGRYWESELTSMSPLAPADKLLDDHLHREIGAPELRYLLVVEAADREHALAASERAAAHLGLLMSAGTITGFDFPARWLPSEVTQRERQSALPDGVNLAAALAQAVTGTPFRGDVFAPFLADVAQAAVKPLLRREDLEGTGIALRVDSLVMPGTGGWFALLPLHGVTDPIAFAGQVAGFNEPHLLFLDLRTESDRLLDAYLREAQTLSLVGGLVIVALLSFSLRKFRPIAGVLSPLGAAVVCTAALLLATSGVLSIFNLFGLLLVVAVGSNYCLFFARLNESSSAGELALASRERTIASVMLANLCTVIGFGILSFSHFSVLHGIGITVAIGAFLCLLFGAILNAPATRAAFVC